MPKKYSTALFKKKTKQVKQKISEPDDAAVFALNRITNATLLYKMMLKYPLPVTIDELIINEETLQQVINDAKKHCIVSFVSAIEVLCKDVIIQFKDKWHSKGLENLLDYEISLNDAFDVINESKAQREAIVAMEYSFQNLDNIQHVFNCLTNNQQRKKAKTKSFLELISNTGVIIDREFTLKTWEGNWRVEITNLFDLRHKIIHQDNESLELDKVNIDNLETLATVFCLSIYCYCLEHSFK